MNINVQINMPSSSTSSGPSPSAPPEESPSSSTSSDQTRSAPPASSSAEGKEPVIEEEEVEYGADDLGYEKEEEEEEEHTVQVPAPTFPDAYPDRNFSVRFVFVFVFEKKENDKMEVINLESSHPSLTFSFFF